LSFQPNLSTPKDSWAPDLKEQWKFSLVSFPLPRYIFVTKMEEVHNEQFDCGDFKQFRGGGWYSNEKPFLGS